MRRILVYSHDTFGLGNIRRMMAVARHLARSTPDVAVLVLSGSSMLHVVRPEPRLDVVKLPCLRRDQQGEYGTKYLPLDYQKVLRLRTRLISGTVDEFDPDLIIVDKKPFGLHHELLPALEAVKRRKRPRPPKTVLLLRDILDAPDTTKRTWANNHYHDAIRLFYDLVLVVGSRKIFDLTSEYDFPASTRDKTSFCGYLGHKRARSSRARLRDAIGVTTEPLVLVTVGGGSDGRRLVRCYLDGLSRASGMGNTKSLVVCGPDLWEQHRDEMVRAASRAPGATLLPYTSDMIAHVEAADLVVSMAGYNTVCELLSTRKRAIVVPRAEPVHEQRIRAQRMAHQELLRSLDSETLDSQALFAAIREELELIHVPRCARVDLSGLTRVERAATRLFDDRPHAGDGESPLAPERQACIQGEGLNVGGAIGLQ